MISAEDLLNFDADPDPDPDPGYILEDLLIF